MKGSIIITILIFFFTNSVSAQLVVKDQDPSPNTLLQVNDEGTVGSISFGSVGGVLTGSKLYCNGTNLYWGSNQLGLAGSAGGWTDDGKVVRLSSATDKVGIGTTTPDAALHIVGNDGAIFVGTHGSGQTQNFGLGSRLIWYPKKSAFRVGRSYGTEWYDSNIGIYSVAMGKETKASGEASLSMGISTTANGQASLSIGIETTASGAGSISIGQGTTASGGNSFASGNYSTASGDFSTALGRNVTAQGHYSVAIGSDVRANGIGAFIFGDNSSSIVLTKSEPNRFYARFSRGYYLYSNSAADVGVYVPPGGNAWNSISDSTKKENFNLINGEEVLQKISKFKLGSWNYIGQDPKEFRHYGPMAQDFYAAFGNDGIGTIGCDTLLSSADFDGINLIAIQALEKRTKQQQETIKKLEDKISHLEEIIDLFYLGMKSKRKSVNDEIISQY